MFRYVLISAVLAILFATPSLAEEDAPVTAGQTLKPAICEQLRAVGADKETIAQSGCCSWHGGVCGCGGWKAKCCDGSLSPSCGCNHEGSPEQPAEKPAG